MERLNLNVRSHKPGKLRVKYSKYYYCRTGLQSDEMRGVAVGMRWLFFNACICQLTAGPSVSNHLVSFSTIAVHMCLDYNYYVLQKNLTK
jgi:hypothetical protein